MKLKQHTKPILIQKGKTAFSFLPSGDIQSFTQGTFLINGFIGTQKEGSANNIYLRVYGKSGVHAYPLLGIRSNSRITAGADSLTSRGEAEGIAYRVTFWAAGEGLWLWDIELNGNGQTVDLLYGQDIGVGAMDGVLTNELYAAQYLGHTIFESENGYVVTSRQNQPQGNSFPYLQQGMLCGKAVGYSTDATQFFGMEYKDTQTPRALSGDLENRNLQFELSYTALQSQKLVLDGAAHMSFYGLFRENHSDAIRALEYREEAERAGADFCAAVWEETPIPPVRVKPEFGEPYSSPALAEGELDCLYPTRDLVEALDGVLLSFFTPGHAHVVLKEKELISERPHGSIITTLLDSERVNSSLITGTNYIYGLFNAQVVVGNTNFHKLISTQRGLLNILKNHGQRLYVRIGGVYRLLTLPAAYEMGMNYSRWIYRIGGDLLTITSYALSKSTTLVLEAESRDGKAYDFLLTTQLVLGNTEFSTPIDAERRNETTIRLCPPADWQKQTPYPELCYDLCVEDGAEWSDDRVFFEDGKPRNGTLLTAGMKKRSRLRVRITGYLENPLEKALVCDFSAEKAAYQTAYAEWNRDFSLEAGDHASPAFVRQTKKLNETAWWYTHNALVHFAVPHGLEQPGGAAWGTRDICQGPFEFFLCTQHYALAREVLLNLFAHQQTATGEWPQWFMFDRYMANAGECHGDVVFWPLKCVGDYLEATGDTSVLSEQIVWLDSAAPAGLDRHLRRAAESIQSRFLKGTFLISYAGGDWDDTLQPANPAMKEQMVSGWTQALAYQVLRRLGNVLEKSDADFAAELSTLADGVRDAFLQYLINDGSIAGFAFRNTDGGFRYLLHSSDEQTGIHCRLLPITRSMIAELVTPAQALAGRELIAKKLTFPDGIRLMDRPAPYDGGVSHFFLRAEQSANVGREISLQYTHAHIRYIEAMAKLGYGADGWNALFTINPILISEAVPNALPRQSNLYFSSSEGAFADRADYSRDFEKLRDGSIPVKGGWRLYSSGPGIYMNQLISSVLGLRFMPDCLELDPVLPSEADGMRFTYCCFGQRFTLLYHVTKSEQITLIRAGNTLPTLDAPPNPYRRAGVRISRETLLSSNEPIEIFC